jgi:hypothetical protein
MSGGLEVPLDSERLMLMSGNRVSHCPLPVVMP